jgi:hypothetical protein
VIHADGTDSGHCRFTGPDGPIDVVVTGPFRTDNSEVAHRAALAGHGVAYLPELPVVDDIRAARLYRLLADHPSEKGQVFVVYPSRQHQASRTGVMIDFLVEMGRALEAWLADARIWGENDTTWLVWPPVRREQESCASDRDTGEPLRGPGGCVWRAEVARQGEVL